MPRAQSVANNIANLSTTGYRREGVMFAEEVKALPVEGGSVAMTAARARYTDKLQGSLGETGGTLDLAVEGDGYFTVMTPQGAADPRRRLHPQCRRGRGQHGRAPAARRGRRRDHDPVRGEGDQRLVGRDDLGRRCAGRQARPRRRRGRVRLSREAGVLFKAEGGTVPVDNGKIVQGFLEQSNVNPVSEMARMVEVQRAYEYGQKLMDQEDERIRRW
ncbi:MAG: flagellar basal body rod C-terminal domain-containing protein [Amaricoccus sp.]